MMRAVSAYSVRMRRMSLLATLMVVFLHSYWMDVSESNDGSLVWWIQDIVSQGFCRSAVPYFFMVFAFWLFKDFWQINGCRRMLVWWLHNVATRLRTIVLPYVVWSFVSALIFFVLHRIVQKQSLMPELMDLGWWGSTLGIIGYPKHAFHLWFLKSLVYYVAFAPIIGLAIRYLGVVVPICSFVLGLFFPDIPYWFSNGLLFVSMGCYISSKVFGGLDVSHCRKHVAVWIVILWCILVVMKVWATKQGFCDLYGVAIVDGVRVNMMMTINAVGVFAMWQMGRISVLDCLDRVVMSAFFMYCIHGLVGLSVLMTIMKVPIVCESKLILWVLKPLLTIALSIAIWQIFRIKAPRVYRILSGGR